MSIISDPDPCVPPARGAECIYLEERLALLGSDVLSPEEEQTVRHHLATCTFCCTQLANYEAVDAAVLRYFQSQPGARKRLTLGDIIAASQTTQTTAWTVPLDRSIPLVEGVSASPSDAVEGLLAPVSYVPRSGVFGVEDGEVEADGAVVPAERSDAYTPSQNRFVAAALAMCPFPILLPSLEVADDPGWSDDEGYSSAVANALQVAYGILLNSEYMGRDREAASGIPAFVAAWASLDDTLRRLMIRPMTARQRLRATYLAARAHLSVGDSASAQYFMDAAMDLAVELQDWDASAECAFFLSLLSCESGAFQAAVMFYNVAQDAFAAAAGTAGTASTLRAQFALKLRALDIALSATAVPA